MVHKVNVRIRICLRGDTIIGTTRELLAARRAISVKVNVLASFLLLKNYFACYIKFMFLNLRYGNSENSVDFSKFFRQNRPRNRNERTTDMSYQVTPKLKYNSCHAYHNIQMLPEHYEKLCFMMLWTKR